MRGIVALNLGGLAAALALSLLGALGAPAGQASIDVPAEHAQVAETQRDGVSGLVDATGHFQPLGDFRRIISTSGVADDLLHALSEPERIVAFSAYAKKSARGYRFGDKVLPRFDLDPETLLPLEPDLVLVNNLSRQDRIARLRESGVAVFDLGDMHGLETLLPNIRTVGTLLGRPDAGRQLADALASHMRALAARVPKPARRSGLYAGIHGDKIYGGTTGSSYADVLHAAGIDDAAAEHYRGWPRYTSEQLLALDPALIITQTGMAATLCQHTGLRALRACRAQGVVEVDTALLLDPGLEMPLAARAIQHKVYGDLPKP